MGQPGGDGGGYPERWWRHRDGRWYPPSLARHPAAQVSLEDDDEDVEVDVRRSWMAWALLVGPIAVMAGLLVGMMQVALDDEPRRADTYTAGGPERTSTTSAAVEEHDAGAAPASGAPSTSAGPSGGAHGGPSPSGSPAGPGAAGGGGDAAGATDEPPAVGTSGPSTGGSPPATTPAPTTPVTSPGSTTTPPATPRTRDDCKDGGWTALVDDRGQPFANQGQCIAWVETRQP